MHYRSLSSSLKQVNLAQLADDFSLLLLGLLPLATFFVKGDSFNIYSIWPAILLLLICARKVKLNTSFYISVIIMVSLLVSLVVNLVFSNDRISYLSIIRLFAIYGALMFYCISTQKNYEKSDVIKLLSLVTICGTIIAIRIIYAWQINVVGGKISAYTIYGIALEENYTGSLQAIIFFACLYLFYLYQKRKILLITAMSIILFSIILTGCRAAALGVLVGLFVFFLEFIKKVKIRHIFLFVISIAIIAYVIYRYIPTWTLNRIFVNSYNDGSNQNRILLWKDALSGWLKSPIFGYGVGNYQNLYASANSSFVAHNTYIAFLVDGGVIYLGLIIALIYSNLKDVLTKKRIYLGMFICWFIVTFIVESNRMVFFWYGLFLLTVLVKFKDATKTSKN